MKSNTLDTIGILGIVFLFFALVSLILTGGLMDSHDFDGASRIMLGVSIVLLLVGSILACMSCKYPKNN